MHQIPKLKWFLSHLALVFAQSIEAGYYVQNEDVIAAAPTGNATSEWSTKFIAYQGATYIKGLVVLNILQNILMIGIP